MRDKKSQSQNQLRDKEGANESCQETQKMTKHQKKKVCHCCTYTVEASTSNLPAKDKPKVLLYSGTPL